MKTPRNDALREKIEKHLEDRPEWHRLGDDDEEATGKAKPEEDEGYVDWKSPDFLK